MPLKLNGSTSGYVIVDAPAVAGTNTLTLPAVTDTVTTNAATQTLSNKTLSSPTITGTATSTGDISTTGTVVMGSSFLRNRIINGAMVIDQRNAGASVSISSAAYTLDRYQMGCTGGGVYTCQQSSTVPSGFSKSMALTVTTPDSSIAATDYYVIQQAIEGLNVYDLGWGASGALTVTLSFWVRSSITGTYAGSLVDSATTTSYVFTYTINVANTWEQKTITISGPTTGTWNTNNTASIYLILDLGSGSNRNGTASTWQTAASYYTRTSGSTNWIATNGATFYLTGVQFEVGSVATPFERRLYGQELALCQRYYQKSFAQGTVPQNLVYTVSTTIACHGGSNGWSPHIPFKVTMRASPTVTTYGNSGLWQSYVGGSCGNWTTTNVGASDNGLYIDLASGNAVTTGYSYLLRGDYVANAEL